MSGSEETAPTSLSDEPAPGEQDPDAPPGMRRVDRLEPSSHPEGTVADPEGEEDAGPGPAGDDPMGGAAPSG